MTVVEINSDVIADDEYAAYEICVEGRVQIYCSRPSQIYNVFGDDVEILSKLEKEE